MKFIIQTICHFSLSIMDVHECLWPIHDSKFLLFWFPFFVFVFSPFIHFFFFFFLILACRSTAQLFGCHFLNQLILWLGCWKTGATTTKTGRRKSNENVWNNFPKEKKENSKWKCVYYIPLFHFFSSYSRGGPVHFSVMKPNKLLFGKVPDTNSLEWWTSSIESG